MAMAKSRARLAREQSSADGLVQLALMAGSRGNQEFDKLSRLAVEAQEAATKRSRRD